MKKNDIVLLCGLVILVALSRVIPHPWNITPIGALALFSGAYISKRLTCLLPIVALLIGDLLMGLYSPVVMFFVYIGFGFSSLIGRSVLYKKRSINRLGIAVLSAAIVFYLFSNFGVWLFAYPQTIDGLILCYINGLPYLGKSLLGDAFYSMLLFGIFEYCKHLFADNSSENGNASI
jgi:Family of unknown function (DUF6580)